MLSVGLSLWRRTMGEAGPPPVSDGTGRHFRAWTFRAWHFNARTFG